MKIALVVERIETWRGGAETSATEFARLLAGRGHEVHVVTASAADAPGLHVQRMEVNAWSAAGRPAAFAQAAAEFVRGRGFDVVHAISPMVDADIYQPRGGSMRETIERNILMRRTAASRAWKRLLSGMNSKFRALLALEREICRPGGPMIAAVSQNVAEQFSRWYGLTPPRVQVIFNGVDCAAATAEERAAERAEVRQRFGIDDSTLVLLAVAHNFRLKGIPCLIDVIANIVSERGGPVCALIVGRDKQGPIRRQAEGLGVGRQVIFGSSVPNIRPFLHAADVLVHLTHYDPCSRIVLEAMVHGTPVITTRVNGASEVIEEGVNGFVVEAADDVLAIAERVRVLRDPNMRAKIGHAGARIAGRISMSRHVDEMMGCYGCVVRNR